MNDLKRKSSVVEDVRPSKAAKTSTSGRATAKESTKTIAAKSSSNAVPVTGVREEDPLFPRGGGSTLTPLEYKQVKAQATKDALFEDAIASAGAAGKSEQRRKKLRPGKGIKSKAKDVEVTINEDHVKIESLNHRVSVSSSSVLGSP